MATVREIYQYLDGLAPFSLQMEFDNAGFLVGRGERAVSKILVSLDITEEVAEEAAELGAELIVSHHPVIFRPAKSVTDGDPDGRVLLALAEHRIAAICAHTNLDAVAGASMTPWPKSWDWCRLSSSIRTGWMAPGVPTASAGWAVPPAPHVCPRLCCLCQGGAGGQRRALRGRPPPGAPGGRGGGACADLLRDALALGCDTFVTADVKYNGFLDAKALWGQSD